MPFLTDLTSTTINDKWSRLAIDLQFFSRWFNRTFTAKAGFVTDFASVPRLPFIYMFLGGRGKRPAVIHDKGYEEQSIPKRQVDLVFFEGLLDTYAFEAWREFVAEESWWKEAQWFGIFIWRFLLSFLMYFPGVVIFGWGTWLKYKYRRKKGLPLRPDAPDTNDPMWIA